MIIYGSAQYRVSIPLREDILSNMAKIVSEDGLYDDFCFNSPKGRYLI